MLVEYKELNVQGIQVQGDVTDKLENIFSSSDLASYNIPADKIMYEDGGNKKNRTMGNARGP